MSRRQNLYQIFKFSASFICENNLRVDNYSFQDGLRDNAIVSAGDNIAFEQIRKLRGDTRTDDEIFNDVVFLRRALHKAKKDGCFQIAKAINQKIFSTLFVSDIVSVETQVKAQYRKLAKNGFYVNKTHFIRFSASAGQIRHNTVLFINSEIYEDIYKTLMCGLDKKITEINLAKFSAYFSLATSSVMWVTKPRVCVIDDFFTVLPKQKIDWIINTEDGKKSIEEREIDVELNSADGQGLISPTMTQQWSEDIGLDYVASSFVVRSIFVKGNLVPFDFHEYAREHNIYTIRDHWGKEYYLDDIDVLLSMSQFKMGKYYDSWQEYTEHADAAGIRWGVARYNKKEDPEMSLTNYQYIQIMNIDSSDIEELIAPTVDWIRKVCSGDRLYALLYCLGGFEEAESSSPSAVYSRAQNLAMKAVVKNPDFLQDGFVQSRIYKSIVDAIGRAKLGKIWMRGNYQFMISDPIAQCRSALGLSPTGEIPADHVYSKFWLDRIGADKDIVLLRSPCLDKHEANLCQTYTSKIAEKWYKWIPSGIIYSIYDTSVLRHSDSDFDGDIVNSTDSPIFIKGSMKYCTNPISYDKQSAPSHHMNLHNLIETDIRGFGTKVGTYSNYSTIIEAMLPMFQNPNQKAQKEELLMRKQLLREINGQEIDRIKGVEAHGPDKDLWLRFWPVDQDDSDIVKAEKYYHNSLVISKKPYFFRYLYPELNKKFKRYEAAYNDKAKAMFKTKLKRLLAKPDKTDEENSLIKRYHKFSPLITTNCNMNFLCREFESTDFDIKFSKQAPTMLPHYDLNDYQFDSSILEEFRQLYRMWSNKKVVSYIKSVYDGDEDSDDYDTMRAQVIDALYSQIRERYEDLNLKPMDALTYIFALSQSYVNFNFGFAWDLLDETILDCIPSKDSLVPVESEDGKEYLGKYYSLTLVPQCCVTEEESNDEEE